MALARRLLEDSLIIHDEVVQALKVTRAALYRALAREKEIEKLQQLQKLQKMQQPKKLN